MVWGVLAPFADPQVRQVPPDFSVRYDSVLKRYEFDLHTEPVFDPFTRATRMHFARDRADWDRRDGGWAQGGPTALLTLPRD